MTLAFYHARMESAVSSLLWRPVGQEWLHPHGLPSCCVGDSQFLRNVVVGDHLSMWWNP